MVIKSIYKTFFTQSIRKTQKLHIAWWDFGEKTRHFHTKSKKK